MNICASVKFASRRRLGGFNPGEFPGGARTTEMEHALGDYEEALPRKPDHAEAHNNCGTTSSKKAK